jgi:DnaJ homolog subfamily A member 1
MADIFEMFGGGGRSRANRERRGENVMHQLKVSLEEMHNGATRYVAKGWSCNASERVR